MEKSPAIIELLAWLRERLGDTFRLADHWPADRLAVGISAPSDPSRLAYILSLGEEQYAVFLETAPSPNSELPYEGMGHFEPVGREKLLGIVAAHLRIG